MDQSKERVLYLDYLRALAIIAVVILHSSVPLLYDYQPDSWKWWCGNFYDSVTRWSVPAFIMISGCLLLNSTQAERPWVFLKRRLGKILIPFIAWSMIYFLWQYRYDWMHGNYEVFNHFFKDILTGAVATHLWFMYLILALYIATPLLHALIKNAPLNLLSYLLLVWFLGSVLILVESEFLNYRLTFTGFLVFSGYVGYFILGHYIDVRNAWPRRAALFLFIGGFAITLFGTFWGTVRMKVFDDHFYSYLSPNVIMMSAGVYLFIKSPRLIERIVNKFPAIKTSLIQIGNYSFGIYLIHILIQDILRNGLLGIRVTEKSFHNFVVNPSVGTLIDAMLIGGISLALVAVMKRIPFVKKIVP